MIYWGWGTVNLRIHRLKTYKTRISLADLISVALVSLSLHHKLTLGLAILRKRKKILEPVGQIWGLLVVLLSLITITIILTLPSQP